MQSIHRICFVCVVVVGGRGGVGSMFTQHCTDWHDRLKRRISMVEIGFKRKFRNGIQKEV